MASQWNTLTIDHHHPLRSFAPFGFPDGRAPFFAGAKLRSMNASLQSRTPSLSSWERNVRQILSQIPSSSYRLSLLKQVEGLGYLSGSWKDRKKVANDLKAIYRAQTQEVAEANLTEFEAKWDSQYPTI
ncbi:MAG: hypothetical protein M1511_06955, partial [Deltaproteobacteria bacterium]|nr:hypothetical protein [Deltaproteobacteria bacterium]